MIRELVRLQRRVIAVTGQRCVNHKNSVMDAKSTQIVVRVYA